MLRTTIMFLAVVFGISTAASCYCQQDQQQDQQQQQPRQIKTIEGNISDLDWAGSKMAIKGLDPLDSIYREVIISVPDDAVIKKGIEDSGFADLEIDDAVTAQYYVDDKGNAILVSLEDAAP